MAHIVIRYLLSPHVPSFARGLGIPRTLGDLGTAAAPPLVSGPAEVAVTFDDGPHPDGTPMILDVLAAHDAKATFFLVGEQVARRPELARRILGEGHCIGLHGQRHRLHPACGAAALADDFARGLAAIQDATGVSPSVHRPPYGLYSPASLRFARELGLMPLLWSRWGRDWRRFTTPGRIARRVLSQVGAGDVILLHDADFYSARGSHLNTAQALPGILKTLGSEELCTVSLDLIQT